MTDFPATLAQRASAAASRLRALQAELADQPAADRQGHLDDAIERFLKQVPGGQQQEFLQELSEQLQGGGASAAVVEPALQSRGPAPKSVPDLAQELAVRWGECDAAERERVLEALRAIGLNEQSGGGASPAQSLSGMPEGVEVQWRRALGLGASDPLDAARALEVGAMATELLMGRDRKAEGILPVLWSIWREVARDDRDKRGAALPTIAAQLVSGHPSASPAKLSEEARAFKSFMVAMIVAIKHLSSEYAKKHLNRFSVDAITNDAPDGTFTVSKDAQCWRHYRALMEGISEDTLESEIKAQYVRIVSQFRG